MAVDTKAHRILIVEDEALIAMQLESSLVGLGHSVEAIATRMNKAVLLAGTIDIDFAILDINVAGSQSFPVADILRRRGISFMFATGYGTAGLVDGYRDEVTLRKPYGPDELERALARAFRAPLIAA
jgi:DNA-binding response OmpR family regulator